MDIMYFFKVLSRRIWLILLVVAVATGTTYFITGTSEKTYKSTARLATGIVNNPDDDGKYVHPQKIEAKFNNLIEIILSRTVINLLSYRLILHDLSSADPFRNAAALRESYTSDQLNAAIADFKIKLDTLGALAYTNERDRFLNTILKSLEYDYDNLKAHLKVQRQRDSDFISIDFSSENPELSAFVVNALAEEFIRYYRTIRTDQKNSAIAFYTAQVEEKLKELNEKKEALKQFKLEHNIVDLTGQQAAILNQIKQYEIQREEEKKKIPAYQNSLENAARTEMEDKLSSYETMEQNRKINNLRNEINYLNDKYISQGSKDKKLYEQIEKLKAELRAAINETAYNETPSGTKNLSAIKNESEINLQIARTSLASIDREIQNLKNQLAMLVALEPQVSSLQREIDMADQAHKEAVSKLSAASAEALMSENTIKLADIGVPSKTPEPTKQLFYSLFSGMLSLSFCIVLLFTLEYLDMSIKTPTQFEKFTGIKLLGYLNQINFINFNLDVNFIDINLESIFHNTTNNQQLESFKQLIRKIRFEVESTDAKRFLITSTREREGKTFMLISLAYSLSLVNKKVLLIDTNFKNNTLTNMLSAKPALEKHFNLNMVKEDIISKTRLKGIDIIGCYEGSYSPSEVFSQTNFHNLINDLSQHYDFIFLEGPALNTYSDSKELISSVEKVISVFSTNIVIKEEDKTSIAYLRGLGDKFMGAILNKVDLSNIS